MGRSRNKKKAQRRSQRRPIFQQMQTNNSEASASSLPQFPPPPLATEAAEVDIESWRLSLRAWIHEQVQALEKVLLQYNSFDMIANLTITQLGSDPETYKETSHKGLAAVIEYATLLYLKHPFNQGTNSVIDGPALDQVIGRIRQIIQAILWYYVTERPQDYIDAEQMALDMFRYRTISQELLVRSPGYAHHQQERLAALFNPLEDWLRTTLGFTLGDVLAIDKAIEEITNHSITTRSRERSA
jgi:hypothetical protein